MTVRKIKSQPQIEPFKLGFKIVRRDGENTRSAVKLEHTTDGHYKFYNMSILNKGNSSLTNFTVLIEYGKINSSGSTKKHGFQTREDAQKFLNKKLKGQLKKNYEIIK